MALDQESCQKTIKGHQEELLSTTAALKAKLDKCLDEKIEQGLKYKA